MQDKAHIHRLKSVAEDPLMAHISSDRFFPFSILFNDLIQQERVHSNTAV